MVQLDILKQINISPWASDFNHQITRYYSYQSSKSNRYALYSNSLDRFILIDAFDLWAVQHAGKLLSSKLSTIVCIFTNFEVPFGSDEALLWTINNKTVVLPKTQSPDIFFIEDSKQIQKQGLPNDFIAEFPSVLKDQEFALFALRTSYAMLLTDLYWNLNSELNSGNYDFYLSFFNSTSEDFPVSNIQDKAQWPGGFKTTIGKIIYTSSSIDEALNRFGQLDKENKIDQETPLYQQFKNDKNLQATYFRRLQLNTFFEHLGWRPS